MTSTTIDRQRTDHRTGARSLIRAATSWWPALLAVAMAGLSWGMDTVTAGQLLPLLPLLYVVAAVVRRRGASWPLVVFLFLLFAALGLQRLVDPAVAIVAIAAGVAVTGLLRLTVRADRVELMLQAAAMAAFSGLALVALESAPEVARYLLAAGWLGHGVWDLVHLRRGAVVSASYAQWCGVLDILIAVQLLMAA